MVKLDRLETYLKAEWGSIAEWCAGARVPLESWPTCPECRGWLDLALRRCMAWMKETGRAKRDTRALQLACESFGISACAVQRRWQRRTKRRMKTGDRVSPTPARDRGRIQA